MAMHLVQIDISINSHDDPPMNAPMGQPGPPIAQYSARFPVAGRRLPEAVKEAVGRLVLYLDKVAPQPTDAQGLREVLGTGAFTATPGKPD